MYKKLIIVSVFLISSVYSLSFEIDYENNTFLKDGQPFRIISGSLHYFRVPYYYWQDRLRKYKIAGLNTIETYVEWSFHEPKKNQFEFEFNKNIDFFLNIAKLNKLLVILRLGPYICSERDNGGLPYWLNHLNSNISIRSSDAEFLKHVNDWFSYLLPKIKPHLYENGGPVILLQIENEYGSYFKCDKNYLIELKRIVQNLIGKKTVLITTDGTSNKNLKCGTLNGVYSTIDFGTNADINWSFEQQRKVEPRGPLFNNEFYPGEFDFWGMKHNYVSSKLYCKVLDKILSLNASVNIYMFHGGTSFGFYSGADLDKNNDYRPIVTSYDFDAPINEFGNLTQKYFDIRNVLKKYSTIGKIHKSDFVELASFDIKLKPLIKNLKNILKENLNFNISEYPLTFDELDVEFGFVLYETTINFRPSIPAKLYINSYGDRVYIYLDNKFIGILSRIENINEIPLIVKKNSKLSLIVENQGRFSYGDYLGEKKGIRSKVYLGNHELKNWTHYGTKDWNSIFHNVNKTPYANQAFDNYEFQFFKGSFTLKDDLKDTFIDLSNWSKGVVFLNGFNLGRYWTKAGPQITLYIPAYYFRPPPFNNHLIILEQEEQNCNESCIIQFVNYNNINGQVPN